MTNKNDKTKFVSLDEVRKEVQKLVQQGVNFRDIAKMKFPIGDSVKKFNIKEISKLKNESIKENNLSNIDEDTAFLFEEFKKGKGVIELIIGTKLKPDFVKEAYAKYLELQNMRIVSTKFYNTVTGLIERVIGQEYADLDEECECLIDPVDNYLTPQTILN